MTTVAIEADNTAWVLASDQDDALVVSCSAAQVYVHHGDVLPNITESAYYPLSPSSQGVTKVGGVPAGNIYVRAADNHAGRIKVAVS